VCSSDLEELSDLRQRPSSVGSNESVPTVG